MFTLRAFSRLRLSDLAENIENSVQPNVQKVFSPTNNQRRRESQEAVRRKSAQKVATVRRSWRAVLLPAPIPTPTTDRPSPPHSVSVSLSLCLCLSVSLFRCVVLSRIEHFQCQML